MKDSFIFFYRSVLETKWWVEAPPLVRCLWLLLMARANFAEGKTARGEILLPGMLVTSWRTLAQALAWRERRQRIVPKLGQVRRAMDHLRRVGEVSWTAMESPAGVAAGVAAGGRRGSPAGGGIVVTLARWALHQSPPGSPAGVRKRSAAGRPAGRPATLKEEDHAEQRRSDPVPGIHSNRGRRNGDFESLTPEGQEDTIRFLREENPKLEAELARVRANGNDPEKVRELEQTIRKNHESIRELEDLKTHSGLSPKQAHPGAGKVA